MNYDLADLHEAHLAAEAKSADIEEVRLVALGSRTPAIETLDGVQAVRERRWRVVRRWAGLKAEFPDHFPDAVLGIYAHRWQAALRWWWASSHWDGFTWFSELVIEEIEE